MDIYPNIEMFDPLPPQSAPSKDVALAFLRHFLYVRPGTEHDQRLQSAMIRLVVETPEGFTISGAKPTSFNILAATIIPLLVMKAVNDVGARHAVLLHHLRPGQAN